MDTLRKRTRILSGGAIAFAVVLGIVMFAWRGSGPKRILRGHATAWGLPLFSPDGAILAVLCEDRTFELWDVATGKSRAIVPATITLVKQDPKSLPVDEGPEFWSAFSHDGRLFAALDGTCVSLWNSATGSLVRTLDGDDVAFPSRGGPFVVRRGSNIFICDERTGEPKLEVGVSREPSQCVMRFIDDDRFLAVAAEYPRAEGTLDLMTFDTTNWSLASSNVIDTPKIVDFDLTSKSLLVTTVVTSDAVMLVCHDARSGQETGRWDVARAKKPSGKDPLPHVDFRTQTLVLPTGMVMVEAYEEEYTQSWGPEDIERESPILSSLWLADLETGWRGVMELHFWSDFNDDKLVLTPDGRSLVEVGYERFMKGAWVGSLPPTLRGWAVKVVPYGGVQRYSLMWRSVRAVSPSRTVRADGWVRAMRIAPDGRTVAVVCGNGRIHLWNAP